jgi:GLPGLI family protein
MKKLFLLSLFIAFTIYGNSQQNQQEFRGVAEYSIKMAKDSYFFDSELVFTSKKSSFVYKKNKKTKWFREDENGFNFQKIYTDSLGYQVFIDLITKESQVREFCRQEQPFIYKDKINIAWKLEDKQKEIGGLKCSKATANFRGRNYIAWYAPEVPTSAGPWKFNGLPGLIVSVKDETGEVSLSLVSLKMGVDTSFPKLASGTEISLSGFLMNMDEAYQEEWEKNDAIINQLQAESPDIEIMNNMPEKRVATEIEFE